jgi:starch synthase (maltosyl-transferring)
MDNSNQITQDPGPGSRILKFRGDTQTFALYLNQTQKGRAWLRTNIGHAQITRREIINQVQNDDPALGRDWFDVPMNYVDDRHFQLTLGLCEVGHFEAKCFFLKESETNPVWPEGGNTAINVEPADTCCANIIYSAFVRQFGPNKGGGAAFHLEKHRIKELDRSGYAVIPPSGTFRDLIGQLDFIVKELGCRVIQLLPIHPTPTTYARMGRFGSPYASLSFTAVDPALAEFDPRATPLDQFVELVDAVHARNARIFIDIAINHTGWAAGLHETHPEWLVRDTDGFIEVPGAWGVRWEDLTKLDYSFKDLWQYMADVFITWCRRGVDGFRCDAGYMIPVESWKYIIAKVRMQYPDTVFNLEGLGGKISVTRDLLNTANFNWAYSELFQNYDRRQIENYFPEAIEISKKDGLMIHFAETHDNNRMAERSKTYARMRTALCALFSHQGAFGFANGVEWYATEKINVHDASSLNWGAKSNQITHIRRLNSILKYHPAFHDQTELKLVQQGDGNYVALLRHHLPSGKKLLILANLDDGNQTHAKWNPGLGEAQGQVLFWDLLTEKEVTLSESGSFLSYLLEPGRVLCLSADSDDIELIRNLASKSLLLPERIELQRLRAKAFDVHRFYHKIQDIGSFKPEQAAKQIKENPLEFCRSLNPYSEESRVITWQWPGDVKREVMVPPKFFLLVRAKFPFRAQIVENRRVLSYEESLPCSGGSFFALFNPQEPPMTYQICVLKLSVYTPEGNKHIEAPLMFLSQAEDVRIKGCYRRGEIIREPISFLGTNGLGGMLRAPVSWGEIGSRYDAFLAANLHPEFPEDRWIMFTRCRAWLVFQSFSQEINIDCLDSFLYNYDSMGYWRYKIPTGQGEHVLLTLGIGMTGGENAMEMVFFRHPAGKQKGMLADHKPVQIILRPDIENRTFHETTKAYKGPEHLWPEAIEAQSDRFSFTPDSEHTLKIKISNGSFVWEPQWQYMVSRPLEAERGLDADSDLFSPGHFSTFLNGGKQTNLSARIINRMMSTHDCQFSNHKSKFVPKISIDNTWEPNEVLKKALDHYVVQRGGLKSVIAGYPWFLDWGRDSLIFTRGLIAAKKKDTASAVLKQFGRFEKDGTIPNMIRGEDAKNRDTSDAPLWFFIGCADLVQADGNEDFLEASYGDRTIRQILLSIASSMIAGTPNGIRMDPESGLIFSPAHFTWMDTNHPAGTPREGYPIEIQALWFAAISFLARIDVGNNIKDWAKIAKQIQTSILDLFYLKKEGYLSDCLHAGADTPAHRAKPDDALRPNQLLAVTLGAVTDTSVCRKILAACEELLIPGAIRSLANRKVRSPLEIVHHGKVLNKPEYPYQGKYKGDEDTKRKPAYHNGTAWTWLFPSFCEAWSTAYGDQGKPAAMAWLGSSIGLISRGCVGHVPEILDGDFPHIHRGCDAQAWGASELLRVWEKLK